MGTNIVIASTASGSGGETNFINIKSLGAVGDGVTDDSAALTTALTLPKTIYFPAGTYVTTNLYIIGVTNVRTWIGDGISSIVKMKSGTTNFLVNAGTNTVHFSKLTLSGGGEASYSSANPRSTINGLFVSERASNCVVSDCVFSGFNGVGIQVDGYTQVAGFRCSGSEFNQNYLGIQLGGDLLGGGYASEYVSVIDCNFNYCTKGILDRSGNNSILGCTFTFCNWSIHLEVYASNPAHGIIANNKINHSFTAGIIASNIFNGHQIIGNQFWFSHNYFSAVTNVHFTGNTVASCTNWFIGGESNLALGNKIIDGKIIVTNDTTSVQSYYGGISVSNASALVTGPVASFDFQSGTNVLVQTTNLGNGSVVVKVNSTTVSATDPVLVNLVGTSAKNVTNVVSLSTSNSTSKPLTNSYTSGVLTLFGIQGSANISLSQNESNIVISTAGTAGEVNVNGEVSVTNSTRMGWVYDKVDVTNRLRSVSGGQNITLTNEGTNIVIASTAASTVFNYLPQVATNYLPAQTKRMMWGLYAPLGATTPTRSGYYAVASVGGTVISDKGSSTTNSLYGIIRTAAAPGNAYIQSGAVGGLFNPTNTIFSFTSTMGCSNTLGTNYMKMEIGSRENWNPALSTAKFGWRAITRGSQFTNWVAEYWDGSSYFPLHTNAATTDQWHTLGLANRTGSEVVWFMDGLPVATNSTPGTINIDGLGGTPVISNHAANNTGTNFLFWQTHESIWEQVTPTGPL